MKHPSVEELTENGLYASLKAEGEEILFRKFSDGVWIAKVGFRGEITDFIRITTSQLQAIANAPSIIPGDGKSPQLLDDDE